MSIYRALSRLPGMTRRSNIRFCPTCGANRRFVGRVGVLRVLFDLTFGLAVEEDTGVGLRKLRCEVCGLKARHASHHAFPE